MIAASDSRGYRPIQIRADVLRLREAPAPYCAWRDLAASTEHGSPDSNKAEQPVRQDWCDADLQRAIDAAEKAGLKSYRVEVAPDGTISIVVGGQ